MNFNGSPTIPKYTKNSPGKLMDRTRILLNNLVPLVRGVFGRKASVSQLVLDLANRVDGIYHPNTTSNH